MRAKELQDYLNENPVVEPNTPKTRILIVVGDSKGCRLQNIVQNIEPEKKALSGDVKEAETQFKLQITLLTI